MGRNVAQKKDKKGVSELWARTSDPSFCIINQPSVFGTFFEVHLLSSYSRRKRNVKGIPEMGRCILKSVEVFLLLPLSLFAGMTFDYWFCPSNEASVVCVESTSALTPVFEFQENAALVCLVELTELNKHLRELQSLNLLLEISNGNSSLVDFICNLYDKYGKCLNDTVFARTNGERCSFNSPLNTLARFERFKNFSWLKGPVSLAVKCFDSKNFRSRLSKLKVDPSKTAQPQSCRPQLRIQSRLTSKKVY